ncbi:Arginine--tRNA ligase [Geodia barretti]|uniref:arginine--tRNA ligase n=1 Tax=Geodia barretti TaxID=519541 RepID=A0AA35RUY3_GEOBA|nr:Arginine--tRNA ligase [Geodia barretti]
MTIMLVKDAVAAIVAAALEQANRDGVINVDAAPDIEIERPNNPEHGDFATNLPLRLARAARANPMQLAQLIAERIQPGSEIGSLEPAPPGFINFKLSDEWLQQQVEAVLAAGDGFGAADVGNGRKVMVEFVSVNPTGPVHVGHTRGAVLGSALANTMQAAGYEVTREYYINDAGSQMEAFYRSVWTRYQQALGREAQMPENGYQGDYIAEIAAEIIEAEGPGLLEMPEPASIRRIGDIAREKMVTVIRDDLDAIGVNFDNWFSERWLFQNDDAPASDYDRAISMLRDGGHLAERSGALWFNSIALGDDRDNVVVRSSGEPTYFASDIAYHYNKFSGRGFDRVIDIWGADHQGHVPRMKAAVSALGVEPENLTVLISQMVTLKRGDETVRASKRTGDFVTLRELVDEVGMDACRYFFLARAASTQMEFDLELATRESSENPVYYVQYAHARNASILSLAAERGIDFSAGDVSLLTHPNELALIRTMLRLSELIVQVAENLEPHHLPHYAMELATAFHHFYENCRVISANPEDNELTLARLKLVGAAQVVFRRTLTLMGMSAPERMER